MSRERARGRSKRKPLETVVADVPLTFQSPESSNIARAEYDPDCRQLSVEFKRQDKGASVTFLYPGFPLSLWIEFFQADSKGKFFASRIRPLYTGTAV